MENGFQLFKPLRLLFLQLLHRDLGPAGDHVGDLVLAYHQPAADLLLLPFLPHLLDLFPLFLLLLLDLPGFLVGFRLNGRLLLLFQGGDLPLQIPDLSRLHKIGQAQLRRRLVDQIDGLIRQEPVIDVAGR